jgi:hypothetical protein
MPIVYNVFPEDNTTKGGFPIMTINESSLFGSNNNIEGGGSKTQLKNKVIPVGLAIKKETEHASYTCKNGSIIDDSLFDKLFENVAKIEKQKISQNNKTKRKKIKIK